MEYKYRMLNPAPFSTESIDFKLSQTHLQNCVLMSPSRVQDSLTYTVSMETIHDYENSPLKSLHQQYLQVVEHFPYGQIQLQSPQKKYVQFYNFNSQQPILSIQIESGIHQNKQQQQSKKQPESKIQKQAIAINLYGDVQNKNQSLFTKKNILRVNQIEFLPQNQNKTQRKQRKMGKIMTRIHSHIKQQRATNNSKGTSRKNLMSPKNQNKPRAYSAKKSDNYNNENRSLFILNSSKKKDKINQSNQSIQHVEEAHCSTLNGSTLTKTNSSSNVNYSPQLIRRKSDYVTSSCISKRKYKQNQIFLTERPNQNVKNIKNYKYINGHLTRQKVYSTLVPPTSKSELTENFGNKQYKQKNIFARNKQNNKLGGIFDKMQQADTNLSDSLSIIALKLGAPSKAIQNTSSLVNKLKYKALSHHIQNAKLRQKNNKISQTIQKNKPIEESFKNADIQMDQNVLMNGIQNKKGWRKIYQNLPKKLFCF